MAHTDQKIMTSSLELDVSGCPLEREHHLVCLTDPALMSFGPRYVYTDRFTQTPRGTGKSYNPIAITDETQLVAPLSVILNKNALVLFSMYQYAQGWAIKTRQGMAVLVSIENRMRGRWWEENTKKYTAYYHYKGSIKVSHGYLYLPKENAEPLHVFCTLETAPDDMYATVYNIQMAAVKEEKRLQTQDQIDQEIEIKDY
nr:hypothetical protein [Sicyoidochytrium minutum DNA virus]